MQSIYYYGKELMNDKTLLAIVGVEGNAMIFMLSEGSNSLLSHFNELLCDDDVRPIEVNQLDLGLKHKLMTPWNASCISRPEGVCLNLERIYKINKNAKQNEDIYNALISTKKIKGYINEEMLFHGTSFENITKIINTGFNRDYNIHSMYGKGTYFSNQALIASKYCKKIGNTNYYAMLACKTYIGVSTVGRQYMNKNELYMNDKVTQYDSLVNDLMNPAIFVINRDYHAIPCFILIFTRNVCNGC